jgi:hypothetical protein
MPECLVCRGSRKIKLPLYHPVSAAYNSEHITMDDCQLSKEFACPECAPKVPEDRVAILQFGASIRSVEDPRYEEAARKQAAHSLVDAILRKDFIQYRKGPVDKFDMCYELTGRLGLVSKSVVASMEGRIAERQKEVAEEVAARAAAKVSAWGSYYTSDEGPIHKSQAIDAIRQALKDVFAERDAHGFRTEITVRNVSGSEQNAG